LTTHAHGDALHDTLTDADSAGKAKVVTKPIPWDEEKCSHTFAVSVEVGSAGAHDIAVRVNDSRRKSWTPWSENFKVDLDSAEAQTEKRPRRKKVLNPNLPADFYRSKLKVFQTRKKGDASAFGPSGFWKVHGGIGRSQSVPEVTPEEDVWESAGQRWQQNANTAVSGRRGSTKDVLGTSLTWRRNRRHVQHGSGGLRTLHLPLPSPLAGNTVVFVCARERGRGRESVCARVQISTQAVSKSTCLAACNGCSALTLACNDATVVLL
jgi:hypothetical protein